MKKIFALILALGLLCSAGALAEGGNQLSLTTGLPTDHEYKAIAVQFDNSVQARPQKNMVQADVIYEIEIARGGYTRYTAIYNDEIPEEVEAIRSARIMHADVSLDWCASFVHFGGQKMAGTNVYDYMKEKGLTTFDGLSDSKNFYREKSRVAPYNVVARLKQMYDAVEAPDAATVHTPLTFSADNPTIKGENVSVFRIPYNVENHFYPSYEYKDGVYYRYYDRQDHRDGATDEMFTFSNVIVMYADYSWYDADSERPVVALTGSNTCEYFIGGKHFSGTWSRDSVEESTVYYDDEGNVVNFVPGKTMIQVIRASSKLEIEYVR